MVEKVEFEPDEKDTEKKKLNLSMLVRFTNFLQFILAMFGSYIILTIDWGIMKVIFLVILVGYVIGVGLQVPFLVDKKLKELRK